MVSRLWRDEGGRTLSESSQAGASEPIGSETLRVE